MKNAIAIVIGSGIIAVSIFMSTYWKETVACNDIVEGTGDFTKWKCGNELIVVGKGHINTLYLDTRVVKQKTITLE